MCRTDGGTNEIYTPNPITNKTIRIKRPRIRNTCDEGTGGGRVVVVAVVVNIVVVVLCVVAADVDRPRRTGRRTGLGS